MTPRRGCAIQQTNEAADPLTRHNPVATIATTFPSRANNKITMERAMTTVTVSGLPSFIGTDLGHSDWLLIDQQRVSQFAACTGDPQFIRLAAATGNQSPVGGT